MMENEMFTSSRRTLIKTSILAGAAGTLSLIAASPSSAADKGDLAILQAAHDLESQAIWAYETAAGKLTTTDVGKTVLALALRNQADHKNHRAALASAITSLGATPTPPKASYDLSSYLNAREGGLDSDANIAKLALALEIDAVLGYQSAFGKLKTVALQQAAGGILPVEASHATAIRAVFKSLMPAVEYTPVSFITPETRKDWIIKV